MVVVHLVALGLTVLVVLVLVPRLIFPLKDIAGTPFDRIMAGAIGLSALNLAVMQILGTFGMMETLGIVFAWVVTWWFFKGRRVPLSQRVDKLVGGIFRATDRAEWEGAGTVARSYRHDASTSVLTRARSSVRRSIADNWSPGLLLAGLAVIVVIAISAYLRFERSLDTPELVPQDSYLALFWTKSINGGRLLGDGIYPQGGYLWMSVLARFYPYDDFTFVRYAGPLMNTLEMVGLYWVVSRVSRSRAAGLLSVAVWGFFAGHPALLAIWVRQIGSMTQEFALLFAICSLVFGARYMSGGRRDDLVLMGAGIYTAVATHALPVPFMLIGFAVIAVVGFVTGAWWRGANFVHFAVVGGIAAIVANYYILLGLIQGLPWNQTFEFYNPGARFAAFGGDSGPGAGPGWNLQNNQLFSLGALGALAAVIIGLLLSYRDGSKVRGRVLASYGGMLLAFIILYDLVISQLPGALFRIRQGWLTGQLVAMAIGMGLGAIVMLASAYTKTDALSPAPGEPVLADPRGRSLLELAGVGGAVAMVFWLFPTYHAVARDAGPSGYPQATEASLEILDDETPLEFTFVGTSEQYQESSGLGFFVEAWVFARDILMSEAVDPEYEVTVPTDRVYIFAEKVPFPGPESPPYGPTEEYYRNHEKRGRIMSRILTWCDLYMKTHDDMSIVFEDEVLRVYKVDRKVDIERSEASGDFRDYTWDLGVIFDDDGDITAERVVPDPEAGRDALEELNG